jgi:branched-chain amino acid transport system substrate-binding protein
MGPDGVVAFVAAASGAVAARVPGLRARALAVDGPRLWALTTDGEMALVAAGTRRVVARAELPGAPAGLAAGGGAAFVADPGGGVVWRVRQEGADGLLVRPVPAVPGVAALAYGGGRLWAVSPLRGLVLRLHPGRGTVELRAPVDGFPRAVAVDGDRVWVARSPGPGAAGAEVAGGLPRERCGPIVGPRGVGGTRLVAVDLPLQGGLRPSAQQVAQAVELVARDRGFRAGRHRVALQVCDDSIARTGLPDDARCAENGRAYARQPEVVAVIGPMSSGCAVHLLPETARGGVAVVSPFASYVGLTRAAPGTPPGELARLRAGGAPHFARVFPADDGQLRAVAATAGARLVIVEDGRREYGALLADGLEALAGRRVAGRLRWDPRRPRDARLAARVAGLRPTAVFLAGTLDTGGAQALRSVRARLPAGVPVYITEGLTPTPLLVRHAGRSAAGVRLVVAGLLPESLGAEGRRFARRVEAVLPGLAAEPQALYAAAAAQTVLDALARSDGTRGGMRRALFATRLRRSPVGPIAFTPDGDVRRPAVTVLRVVPGARGGTFAATEVERVVRP